MTGNLSSRPPASRGTRERRARVHVGPGSAGVPSAFPVKSNPPSAEPGPVRGICQAPRSKVWSPPASKGLSTEVSHRLLHMLPSSTATC